MSCISRPISADATHGDIAAQTATTLTTLMLVLSQNLEVQKRVHEEIDKTIGSDRLSQLEDRASMPYTEALMKETYRYALL